MWYGRSNDDLAVLVQQGDQITTTNGVSLSVPRFGNDVAVALSDNGVGWTGFTDTTAYEMYSTFDGLPEPFGLGWLFTAALLLSRRKI